jgi:GxxExxY protein
MSDTHTLKNAQIDHELSGQIIGAAIEVHRILGGPGLLESIYEAALCYEFSLRKLNFQRQLPVPVRYKGVMIRDPLHLDLLVEGKIIVEVKATEQDPLIHQTQLLTYLRLTGIHLGLLINFGKRHVKDGICRLINSGNAHS